MDVAARTNPWKIGFIILGIAVAIWIGYGLVVPRLFMDWQKSSQFGDMFGGIGALFSGLALAGVVVAIKMQKEELERSTKAQTASSEALTKQIEVMSITAQLAALDTLYRYHAERADRYLEERPEGGVLSELDSDPALTRRITEAKQKRNRVLERIDSLIRELEKRPSGDADP